MLALLDNGGTPVVLFICVVSCDSLNKLYSSSLYFEVD